MTDIITRILRGRVTGQQYPDVDPPAPGPTRSTVRTKDTSYQVYGMVLLNWTLHKRPTEGGEIRRRFRREPDDILTALENAGLLLSEDDAGRLYPMERMQ